MKSQTTRGRTVGARHAVSPGGCMNRKGFTLIELLIVVVIIGILAAIAIPKFANTKEKAYIASMKSDMRNLVTAEEAYFADSIKYTTSVSCTNPAPAGSVSFCTTPAIRWARLRQARHAGGLDDQRHEHQYVRAAGSTSRRDADRTGLGRVAERRAVCQ